MIRKTFINVACRNVDVHNTACSIMNPVGGNCVCLAMKPQPKTSLVLFRNDLRIHDNEALLEASKADRMIPVYVFDPRKFSATEYGFPRVGPHRIRFLMESVQNLRKNLRLRNSDLIIRTGRPEAIVPELAREFGVTEVFLHTEATSEERVDEDVLEAALAALGSPVNHHQSVHQNTPSSPNPPESEASAGIRLRKFWGSTLYHPDDLPLDQEQLPDVFTDFRKRVEKKSRVREIIAMPDTLPPCPVDDPGELPAEETLRALPDHFLWDESHSDQSHKSVLDFKGGEDAALQRVRDYIWDGDHLKNYKETRNGLLGADYSSKFSPWLATGALSPRHIHEEVRRYEKERVKNSSTYWMIFELIWRDYFKFVFIKHENALFRAEGIRKTPHPVEWQRNEHLIRAWQRGETGIPSSHIHQPHLLSAAEQRKYEIGIGEDYPAPVIDLEASYEKLRS